MSAGSFEQLLSFFKTSETYYLVKVDTMGNYAHMNDYFLDKYSAYYDGPGKPAILALHPDDHALSYETFMKCCAEPDKSFQVTLRKLNGRDGYIITQWDFKAALDDKKNITGVTGVGYDITEFESRQEHIRFLASTLRDVAYRQSHVVRKPLANIMGLIALAEGEEDPAVMQSLLRMLKTSCAELEQEFNAFVITNQPEIS